MNNLLVLNNNRGKIRSAVFDVLVLGFLYYLPAISHLLIFPLYLIEPMRIMLILSIAHTSKRNTYFIALSLPLFSLMVSTHPSFYKMLLITTELVINASVFYVLIGRINNSFVSMILSISISKAFYYTSKFLLIKLSLLNTLLLSTPVFLQIVIGVILSAYIYLTGIKRSNRGVRNTPSSVL